MHYVSWVDSIDSTINRAFSIPALYWQQSGNMIHMQCISICILSLKVLPLGREALIRRAASALKYIVYNNYAVPNGIRTFFLLFDREKYQTNIDRQMLHKWYLFKYTAQKEDHGGACVSSLYYRHLLYSADKCHLMVNVGTVDSPALGGGYGVGRWPANPR